MPGFAPEGRPDLSRPAGTRPGDPDLRPHATAFMFPTEQAAMERAERIRLDCHSHWRVQYDIASRQHYITKHRYKPTGAGTCSRSHQVLCADRRWRASHRVRLPDGRLA